MGEGRLRWGGRGRQASGWGAWKGEGRWETEGVAGGGERGRVGRSGEAVVVRICPISALLYIIQLSVLRDSHHTAGIRTFSSYLMFLPLASHMHVLGPTPKSESKNC